MKGFIPTPEKLVDLMVSKLFSDFGPGPTDRVLDPGCGTGAFIDGVIRWCVQKKIQLPNIVGIELDPARGNAAIEKYKEYPQIKIEIRDYLIGDDEQFRFIIGNPPYVPITKLDEVEKKLYRNIFRTAKGRFDLYLLFFEKSLTNLLPNGRMVFITPEKFLYVETAKELRKILSKNRIDEIDMIDEDAFADRVTYPTITTVVKSNIKHKTKIILRNGEMTHIDLPLTGDSWLPAISGVVSQRHDGLKLTDICLKISCGIATGADQIFILNNTSIPNDLKEFAYPTIAGREIKGKDSELISPHSMLVPYHNNSKLMRETDLGPFLKYLRIPENEKKLRARTCTKRKPWYAFHETPILSDILKPKILCKDITETPIFVIDKSGKIIPRHSVYYIIPKDIDHLDDLVEYLNSEEAKDWLESHCQRAAKGYIRIQSNILKEMPVPERFGPHASKYLEGSPIKEVA
jgi:adenine-specific DNA-methyltransferase